MTQPYTNAKRAANIRWDGNNKDRIKYLQYRSRARNFVKAMSKLSDLDELSDLIAARRNELEHNQSD
ncbi:hypothetical protein RA086_08180 [Lactiplantibacillus sp. WILCCON 0030]|uniref:Phage protein n=1 Tax=Lactiplantibacillus brownii TaxID=3069269 RepID=A0ABU1A9G6_9LACO|nr:hypothetical protein [Lactiplantibacillus brownii]MDQ7937607.1 hypothetical protein [Lactiplantibacillus brownii]